MRFYPFYYEEDDLFFVAQCFEYELDEYNGYPLSTVGYRDEDDLHDDIKRKVGKLPSAVVDAYMRYSTKNGLIGILDRD